MPPTLFLPLLRYYFCQVFSGLRICAARVHMLLSVTRLPSPYAPVFMMLAFCLPMPHTATFSVLFFVRFFVFSPPDDTMTHVQDGTVVTPKPEHLLSSSLALKPTLLLK